MGNSSGLVSHLGGARNLWGAKKHLWKTCDRLMTGVYVVYHSVGHKNYSVQVTPKGTHKVVANVDGLSDEYFTVYIYDTGGGQLLDSDFFFTVIGNN